MNRPPEQNDCPHLNQWRKHIHTDDGSEGILKCTRCGYIFS